MLGAELLPPLPPRLCGLKFGQTWISPSLSRGANRSRWYLGSHGSNSWCFTSAKYCKMRRQKNEISVISRHHCLRAMFSPKIAQTQPATEKFQEAVDWCWRRGVEVLWEMWKPRGAASLPACPAAKGWHSWLRRNGRGKKIPEMEDKKGLFALKKEKKKRVHRISCSAFCRQSYPPPILLGDCWLEARNAFHFLPSLPDPPPSPLLPPSNVSNPISFDKSDRA